MARLAIKRNSRRVLVHTTTASQKHRLFHVGRLSVVDQELQELHVVPERIQNVCREFPWL